MTTHFDEELFALLSGDLGHDETLLVAAHLRECGECTSELVSVAVAFGALGATRRAERLLQAPTATPHYTVGSPFDPSSEQKSLRTVSLRRTAVARWAVAAALIVTLATGTALALGRSTAAPVSATAALHHLDAPKRAMGFATVRASSHAQVMDVVTTGLPKAPANHFYEVWLLQPVTNKMLPVGLLSPSGTGSYAVASAMMSQYSAVDISLQENNGNPAHSTISVLRGTVVSIT